MNAASTYASLTSLLMLLMLMLVLFTDVVPGQNRIYTTAVVHEIGCYAGARVRSSQH